MFTLANSELSVEVLDPITDAGRLGPRFCAGAFVWQINDHRHGPLLTGPEWPDPEPDPFNAQGLPEAFRDRTRAGEPLLWRDETGLAPGAGLLRRNAAGEVVVVERCNWELDTQPDAFTFRTSQRSTLGAYRLTRRLELKGRTLTSFTSFTNTGPALLALQWFAHPFFALGDNGLATLALPPGTRLNDETGFVVENGTLRFRRRFEGKDDGAFALLALPADVPLQTTISHPRVGTIGFSTSFVPGECPIWANGNTVSIEPYRDLRLAPRETQTWSLHYRLGSDL